MKIALVRQNVSSQIFSEKWESFVWYQMLVTGCEGRARSKMKTFSDLNAMQRYITRLRDGGWISTDEYTRVRFILMAFWEVGGNLISTERLREWNVALESSWLIDAGSATRVDIA